MRCIILGLFTTVMVGCNSVEPVGPLAGMWGKNSPKSPAKPGKEKKSKNDKDTLPPPVTVPAVKPTPPLNFIYPDEVLPDNPQESVQKLKNELEAEGKNIPAPPVTAEVSHYKGGVKQ